MRIVSIVGTRPQFVKLCSLSRELRKHHTEILIHTGQHYDFLLSETFFNELDIPEPDYNLEVGSGSHCEQTARILMQIEPVLLYEKPDLMILYGDTNSTVASALAAAKMQIKICHVEAGLRSFDETMPEEINRVITDHCSAILFCPTNTAVDNLATEGITTGVHLTGDVMADTFLYYQHQVEASNILAELQLDPGDYFLATLHRACNTDSKANLKSITEALCKIEQSVVFPVHPRTAKQLKEFGLFNELKAHIRLIEPLGYLDFAKLLKYCKKVITDSGGMQKEAYLSSVPCITLRDTTEWPETLIGGWNVLAGVNTGEILNSIFNHWPEVKHGDSFSPGASKRVVQILSEYF